MRLKAMVRGTLDLVLMGGFAMGMVALTGCGSSGNGGSGGGGGNTAPTGALATGGAANIYTIQYAESGEGSGGASILGFGIGTSTNPSPTVTLVTPTTMVAYAVATDSTGQVYVGGQSLTNGDGEILVYAAGATGTATPTRTITIDESVAITINSMAVDSAGNIYVAGENINEDSNVAVFAAGANGASTPTTLLASASLTEPLGIAVDGSGKIYVSNITETGGQILVFAAGATGSAAPVETISATAATSNTESIFVGLAVDGSGNIFASQDAITYDSSGDATNIVVSVDEFASGATGIATPTKSIAVATGFTLGAGLRLDGVGNFYLITDTESSTTSDFSLLGYGPNASGSVTPGVTLTPSALTNAGTQIAVH